ncbi:MAG: DNA-3-methyladenine glycosylase [Gemmatimonadota bacterium]
MSRTRRAALLPVSFFRHPVDGIARRLLGTTLQSEIGGVRVSGKIVETEAYMGRDDPASHGYQLRRNARNAALYAPAGTWYIYLSYGIHWCMNLVCRPEGHAAAVLIRALEPLEGLETMRLRRGNVPDRDLCSGPGKLCQALGVTVKLDGIPMWGSPVIVSEGVRPKPSEIIATPRIGISKAVDLPLRFVLADSPWVSGVRKSRSRR